MRQILQGLKDAQAEIAEVPVPRVARSSLLIRSTRSLLSAGTERMLVEFSKANLVKKARQQPDKVRMVVDKAKTDGVLPTIEAVRKKLDQPLAMGYCNVGVVDEVGAGVTGFQKGDRVASNGEHAEVVCVPANLCAKVPDSVSDDEAAFAVIGAVGLQGIRLVQPTLGEAVVVLGLGLVGSLTVQLLRAHGCRVLGADFDPRRLELVEHFGAQVVDLSAGGDLVSAAQELSRGRGVDAVLIAASAKGSETIHQAAQMCRKRGRIVLVGVTGLALSRADFYEKELTFQVSCSYGPGRYDPAYEEKGQDYPVGYVRWTEQRNFEAVLDMMADGRLDVKPLISHRFSIQDAQRAYQMLGGAESALGVLLEYPGVAVTADARRVRLDPPPRPLSQGERADGGQAPLREESGAGAMTVSFVGAGNYATSVLIPAFKEAGAGLRAVVSSKGVSGVYAGRKFGFEETTTDTDRVLSDPDCDAVVIATRHDSHGQIVVQALAAGKHVFVEKPLCLTLDELAEVEAAYGVGGEQILMVGFNRRFAPQVRKMKEFLAGVPGPKAMVMTVNAGAISVDHWIQDKEVGGGRVIGEACHFVDLLRFLAGAPITGWERVAMEATSGDTVGILLSFADGSVGSVHYFANGSRSFPKERLEVFVNGRVLQLDNFRRLTGFGWSGFRKLNLWRQDKGQKACAMAFMDAIRRGRPSPIPYEEVIESARVTIEVADSLR